VFHLSQLFHLSTELPAWLSGTLLDTHEEPTKEVQTFAGVLRHAAPLIVDRLLQASTSLAFETALDEVLADEAAAKAFQVVVEALFEQLPSLPTQEEFEFHPALRGLVGETAMAQLEAETKILFAQADMLAQVLARLNDAELQEAKEALGKRPLDWFVTEDWPPLILQLVLKWTVGNLCALMLAVALARGERLPDWLAILAVDKCIDGAHAYTRYVGSLPDIRVSSEVLSPVARLDFKQLELEHREANWGLKLAMLKHRASQQLVTAPFGEFVDEQ
jgi:hypothetical protein